MRKTILAVISKREKTGGNQDLPKSSRPKMVPELHQRYIDEKMTENDELKAAELIKRMVAHFGICQCRYSVRTSKSQRKLEVDV